MIFQDPYASLNPRMSVFDTLAEPLLYHGLATRKNVTDRVLTLMDEVGLARSAIRKYPHEFSGGQRQRIAIGRAIATKPELVIADEPVSALDVTIQAQILDLILTLVEKHNLTMLFISHDLSVVRYIADRVAVMHHGKLVEMGNTETLFANPEHDYTKKLLSAIPVADPVKERERQLAAPS
jgi:ABC-type oligopeptide transport system ATPase subunit